jgi:hypothetical protein
VKISRPIAASHRRQSHGLAAHEHRPARRRGQRRPEPLKLLGAQVALARLLAEALDVPARVRAIRPQSPALGAGHHDGDHLQRPVRVGRGAAQSVMQGGDVRAGDLGDGAPAERGEHGRLEDPAVERRRARLGLRGALRDA